MKRSLLRAGYGGLVLAGCLWLASTSGAASGRAGVLVLAHGGNPAWNATVEQAIADAQLSYPTAVAFGMGMMPAEVAQLRQAVERLQAQGVEELLVVPLLVSSHSEVYRQYEYLLGLRTDAPWPGVAPVTWAGTVRMATPLDAHPYVADIVLERAQALSRDPAGEVVVLVAHGPNHPRDHAEWLTMMQVVAGRVQAQGRFAAVEVRMLRDDARPPVQQQATRSLRYLVEARSRTHRVLIVPLLMARGGIEHKIPQRLEGLMYVFSGDTLLPHPRIAAWIRDTVRQLAHAVAWVPARHGAPEHTDAIDVAFWYN